MSLALMHLLGSALHRASATWRHQAVHSIKGETAYDALKPMISSDRLNIKAIRAHWDEILRLATSIKQGTVTASLMLRKLGSYPRQNGLAVALRELGRIERTLFILNWLQSVELRRRVQAGLNKGRRATRWPGRCSSTGRVKSATAALNSNATGPAASIW
jgi:TnpA family transposase